jgi:hypothetical protein
LEPEDLLYCKIWGFHGGDYEELGLLGQKVAGSRPDGVNDFYQFT